MNVEIGTETPIFLFWEYFFQNFGILSLQCVLLIFWWFFSAAMLLVSSMRRSGDATLLQPGTLLLGSSLLWRLHLSPCWTRQAGYKTPVPKNAIMQIHYKVTKWDQKFKINKRKNGK
jgi:hypothetical protein